MTKRQMQIATHEDAFTSAVTDIYRRHLLLNGAAHADAVKISRRSNSTVSSGY